MVRNTRRRRHSQAGYIITIELLVLSTILVLGLIVGMVNLRDAVLAELSDLSESIGALNQSYTVLGVSNAAGTAATPGSTWQDAKDSIDATHPIDTGSGNAAGTGGELVFIPSVNENSAPVIL